MIDFLQSWFNTVWALFSINWPGFSFTIGQVFIGVLVAVTGLVILGKILGFGIGKDISLGALLGSEQKGGNSKSIVVSDERKGDAF